MNGLTGALAAVALLCMSPVAHAGEDADGPEASLQSSWLGGLLAVDYEDLSWLEEPLAWEVGDVTLSTTGLVDVPYTLAGSEGTMGSYAHVEAAAKTQLPNRWRVSLSWIGEYADHASDVAVAKDGFDDDVVLSVGGTWGSVVAGNVSKLVRRSTRRLSGAGNGRLAFDDNLGALDDWGSGYVVRLGAWQVAALADPDANVDVGATYQRPTGMRDYRVTMRFTEGVLQAPEGDLDTRGGSAVAEAIYGSTVVDVGAGFERLHDAVVEADRWYLSSGVHHKTGRVTLSLEGHHGRIEDKKETSAALGLQYDIARGLAVKLGVNYNACRATVGDVVIGHGRGTRTVMSLRYGF